MALAEKPLLFELVIEVPWDSTAITRVDPQRMAMGQHVSQRER